MNSKAEVFKGKTKIAIRDLHKTLKAEATKSEDKNLQELAGKSRNSTVAQNETENSRGFYGRIPGS